MVNAILEEMGRLEERINRRFGLTNRKGGSRNWSAGRRRTSGTGLYIKKQAFACFFMYTGVIQRPEAVPCRACSTRLS